MNKFYFTEKHHAEELIDALAKTVHPLHGLRKYVVTIDDRSCKASLSTRSKKSTYIGAYTVPETDANS